MLEDEDEVKVRILSFSLLYDHMLVFIIFLEKYKIFWIQKFLEKYKIMRSELAVICAANFV